MVDDRDNYEVHDGAPPPRPSDNVLAFKRAKQERMVISLPEFLRQFVPPDYLIDGIVARGFFYSLTGRTGIGKTAVAVLIAILVAKREPQTLGGHDVERGRVLYITRENPTDVRMRLIGASVRMGFKPADLEFLVIERIDKLDRRTMKQIKEEIEAFGELALVIVDTSAALFQGEEENNNAQVGRHARAQRDLTTLPGRPAVITLCHPGKSAEDKDSMVPRGGGAFIAELDGNLCLTSAGDRMVELHWTGKMRGPDFETVMFRLETVTTTALMDSKGRLLPTVMAVVISSEEAEEATLAARKQEAAVLKAMREDPGASMSQLAEKCGLTKSQVQRVLKRLERQKLVTNSDRTWTLTKAGEQRADDKSKGGGTEDAGKTKGPDAGEQVS